MAAHKAWRLHFTAQEPVSGQVLINKFKQKDEFSIDQAQGESTGTSFSNGLGAVDAFNTNVFNNYDSLNILPGILGKNYGASPQDIRSYELTSNLFSAGKSPVDWTFEYSDNTTTGLNGSWTVAHTVTGETGWAAGETRVFILPAGPANALEVTEPATDKALIFSGKPYTAFRLTVIENGASGTGINELELFRKNSSFNISSLPNTTFGAVNNFRVFNQDFGDLYTNFNAPPHVVGITLNGDVQEIDRYVITIPANAAFGMLGWDLEGSLDTTDGVDGVWELLSSVRNAVPWVSSESREYLIIDETFGDIVGQEVAQDSFSSNELPRVAQLRSASDNIICTLVLGVGQEINIPVSSVVIQDSEVGVSSTTLTINAAQPYISAIRGAVAGSAEFYLTSTKTLLDNTKVTTQLETYKLTGVSYNREKSVWTMPIRGTRNFSVTSNQIIVGIEDMFSIESDLDSNASVHITYDPRIRPCDYLDISGINYKVSQIISKVSTLDARTQLTLKQV